MSPFKSNYGFKNCLECNIVIYNKKKRDIERKKFCSHSCRAKYISKGYTLDHMKKMWELSNTEEANKKKSHKGESHPKYIKDRSKVKGRPRYEMSEWRKSVFERDDYTCQECGVRGGKLQADHILPYSLFEEYRWDLDNGRTLCVDCHKKTNTYGQKAKNLKREDFINNN
jgi:hypothetical protein